MTTSTLAEPTSHPLDRFTVEGKMAEYRSESPECRDAEMRFRPQRRPKPTLHFCSSCRQHTAPGSGTPALCRPAIRECLFTRRTRKQGGVNCPAGPPVLLVSGMRHAL